MKRLAVVLMVSVLVACGSDESSSPEGAVEQLMRALDDGDCAAAKAVVVTPSALDCGLVEESSGSFQDDGIDLDDVTYTAGDVADSSATVTIDWGNGDPSESYDLEQVDGQWLVDFDSAA